MSVDSETALVYKRGMTKRARNAIFRAAADALQAGDHALAKALYAQAGIAYSVVIFEEN